MLEVRVKKRLGEIALEASFGVEGAQVLALFGPSGAGKSSLVNLVAGLLTPDQGRISLGGEALFDSGLRLNLPPEKRRVGYVFQEGRLFPHLSVRSNLVYGMKLLPAGQGWARLDQVVELLGLESLLSRRPAKLSGGEKQRVALGRALLASPRLLLLDEPLASLDQARKDEVLPFIAAVTRQYDLPVLYVSHDPREILQLADQVLIVDQGQASAPIALAQFQAWALDPFRPAPRHL